MAIAGDRPRSLIGVMDQAGQEFGQLFTGSYIASAVEDPSFTSGCAGMLSVIGGLMRWLLRCRGSAAPTCPPGAAPPPR